MVGHSITSPLSSDSIRNLELIDEDLDLALVSEVLEASANREQGIFKQLAFIHPTRRLADVTLCRECMDEEAFFAWVEELCQLKELATMLERRIDLEKQLYDIQWWNINSAPEAIGELQFSDIPWPVSASKKIVSPNQLRKSDVHRFLLSDCILKKYLCRKRRRMLPRDVMAEYKRRWDPQAFKRCMPWYNRALCLFNRDRASILEGVQLIRGYLDEFDHDPKKRRSVVQRSWKGWHRWMKPSSECDLGSSLRGRPRDRSHLASLGVALAVEVIAYVGFLKGARSC